MLLFNHITHGSAYETGRSKLSQTTVDSVFRDRDPRVPQAGLVRSEIYLEISTRRKQPRTHAIPSHSAIVVGLARLSLRSQMPPTPSTKLEAGKKWKPTALMRQGSDGCCCSVVTDLRSPKLEVQGPRKRNCCSCPSLWQSFIQYVGNMQQCFPCKPTAR